MIVELSKLSFSSKNWGENSGAWPPYCKYVAGSTPGWVLLSKEPSSTKVLIGKDVRTL